jgi:hypothetical protein
MPHVEREYCTENTGICSTTLRAFTVLKKNVHAYCIQRTVPHNASASKDLQNAEITPDTHKPASKGKVNLFNEEPLYVNMYS